MSETRKLYIADWHYAHANILAFDNRPFKTVEEMNEELVKRWNAAVNPGDTVYVLGDMFWCISSQAVPILQALNGQKFLIKGNHDRSNDGKFVKEFAKSTEYLEVNDNFRTSYFAIIPFRVSKIIITAGIICMGMYIIRLSIR